jgi:hypothetical protein
MADYYDDGSDAWWDDELDGDPWDDENDRVASCGPPACGSELCDWCPHYEECWEYWYG